jgi:hypothetical protein
MRKLLVAAVGLLTVLTAIPVYAVDVNFSGEVRVRGFWDDNLTDGNSTYDDMSRFNDMRFRLKTSIKAGVTTGVVVLDFANCYMGASGSTVDNVTSSNPNSGANTGNCRFGTGGLGHSFNDVGVREAYLKIDLSKVGLILGRQTLKLGHGIIFDDTADAITVVLPMGSTTITGSMLQVTDNTDALGSNSPNPTTGINQDTTVWLVNVGMDHGSHIINLYDAFLYDQSISNSTTVLANFYPTVDGHWNTFTPVGDKLWINYMGISLDAKNGPLALALEGTYDIGSLESSASNPTTTGKDIRVRGWNVMGDATADTGGAKLGGTVIYTSSQSPSAVGSVNVADISGNFQLGNILVNGEMNTDRDGSSLSGGAGGQGLFAVKLHADVMPTEKLDVGGAAIYALTPDRGNSSLGLCGTGCDRTIGYELDANAKYTVDDNLVFSAGAGYLITANGARDFYNGGPGGPNNSNLWKLSAKAVFTF